MSQIRNEVLHANLTYAARLGAKAALAMPPARQFVIVTCMDARLDPAKYAGLAEDDAHPLAGDFLQAARHLGMVCNPPYR